MNEVKGCGMSLSETVEPRPNLSVVALVSFIVAFAVARTFTSISPDTVLLSGDIHVHHFWYGLAMLALGGWLGISYDNPRVNRVAAILFGAGGGLIGDEVGLLLTLESENYWAGFTYTIVIVFVASVSILILLNKYSSILRREFTEFVGSNSSLYFGVFLAAVSVAFILETENVIITAVSGVSTALACGIVLFYFIGRIKRRLEKPTPKT
jgi:uncharacterized membrane protein